MWFEPERVTDVENLVTNFDYKPEWAIQRPGVHSISNNIGIPECYEWTVSRICKLLKENKVEIYREDNNSDPGSLWRYLDSQESGIRTGITECKFVEAHYRMWDEIIDCTLSFGGAGFVDSCASGGGRNDLESLRRGIPLLRSDSDRSSTSLRLSMTTSFNRWVPFCGANTKEKAYELDPTGRTDVYTWRASYLPALNVDSQFTQDPDQDFDMLRFGLNEWKQVRPFPVRISMCSPIGMTKTTRPGSLPIASPIPYSAAASCSCLGWKIASRMRSNSNSPSTQIKSPQRPGFRTGHRSGRKGNRKLSPGRKRQAKLLGSAGKQH